MYIKVVARNKSENNWTASSIVNLNDGHTFYQPINEVQPRATLELNSDTDLEDVVANHQFPQHRKFYTIPGELTSQQVITFDREDFSIP